MFKMFHQASLDDPASLWSQTPGLDDCLAFFKFVMDCMPIAIVHMDSALRISHFNHWTEGISGYSWEDAVGWYCGETL